ncbi:F0F1 ATP synthase subunit delta [Phocaeicola sp.]
MYIGVVSMRYAKALLAYANDAKVEDAVYKEALQLRDSFALVPELRQAMENPVLASEVKLKLIMEAAGGKVTGELKRFAQLVLKEKREKFLQFMVNSYIGLYRKQKNINTGRFTTAYPVAPEVLERMRKMVVDYTKGTAEFTTRVDPSLEGGFIFEISTYRLDASVASQMRRVKRQFIEKNRRIV